VRGIRLVVSYDGTGFHGWQRQPGLRTVQGVMEEHLGAVMEEPVRLTGAGRTDAGCHARGQVASFATGSRLPVRAVVPLLERRLPADLRVRDARDVDPSFDARRSATARRYAYRLIRTDDVLWARFAWRPPCPIDVKLLARATAPLEGEHDCAAFQSSGSTPVPSVCRIGRVEWQSWEGGLRLDIVADHFLYHMVRTIVGTALVLQKSPDPTKSMRDCLGSRDRRRAGPTAPAHGLCLEEVYYGEEAGS